MNLVVVESPAKAKTINKYLGSNFKVLASFGHVRDLPSKDGSVRPAEDFAMSWEVDSDSKKRMKDISDAAKGADILYLATDPDREGEAISWHVMEILKNTKGLADMKVKRVVFNEITKSAVLDAIANPRDVDQELVDAYLARRALDYLVGFTLSPVLWRKLPGARSAGRVQSVALRLICQRELEIESFKPREYWTIDVAMKTPSGDPFMASLTELNGQKLDKFDLSTEAAAKEAVAAIQARGFSVSTIESKPAKRNPAAPFTTSTLQQEAARKLGFSASRTMRIAQKLYEGMDIGGETVGLITYMRTDGVQLAGEAISGARSLIAKDYGDRYVPPQPRIYKAKAKNAQEAHEAIRPTDLHRRPAEVSRALTEEQLKLYELIWKRTVASQMESAQFERTVADIAAEDGKVMLRARGSVLTFPGFLALYQEGLDDTDESDDDRRLPALAAGDAVSREKIIPEQHFTEPPPRYTEASLVRKMEELGIGRPSTYASILDVLRDRSYVRMDRNRFVPEDKGRLVTAFLESFFSRYVEYDFTAQMEEQLDEISAGKIDWKTVLREFWAHFSNAIEGTADLRVAQVLDALNDLLGPHIFPLVEEGKDPRACPSCADGRLSLKLGKFGAFIGCSNYPECKFTRQLGTSGDGASEGLNGTKVLGEDNGDEISLRGGRFGQYLQRGEAKEGVKPPRVSIPKDIPLESIDLEKAVALLSLPREVGIHPETGKAIAAGIGRYGPYINHDGKYANLPSSDEVFTIGINRAVSVLAESRPGRQASASVLKELGEHPADGKPVNVMKGRFGPYVTHNKVNATLPRGSEPETFTLEEALPLLEAKAGQPKKGKAKAAAPKKAAAKTAKKAPAKKAAAKSSTAKKAAPKKAPKTAAGAE
ncbi:type I DNA topoisomerase [Iodidimonas sp. SYSU 1G8]|uniref:type I DNA topoisomerase n=1 Tax=Iodidimonas sp. SYSU 1G8 TaxID=3133967 RepID=UPI0031FEEECD